MKGFAKLIAVVATLIPALSLAASWWNSDWKYRKEISFDLMDRLAAITADCGGRMYPAKDACMSAAHFQQFYPQWERFSGYVDRAFSSSFWQRVTGLG